MAVGLCQRGARALLRQLHAQQVQRVIDADTDADDASGPFTRNDLTFLKSLRISTEETERISSESAESTGEDAAPAS